MTNIVRVQDVDGDVLLEAMQCQQKQKTRNDFFKPSDLVGNSFQLFAAVCHRLQQLALVCNTLFYSTFQYLAMVCNSLT